MSIKIGFNNFKAFGPKMQYYTKKPITLVYGPNSIGKSSFLHSQLLFDSLKSNYMSNVLPNKNFAGDTLNIGDFNNFIYKHNEENIITYEYILDDLDETLSYVFYGRNSILKKLYDLKFFEQEITKEKIHEKLESYYEDSNLKYKDLVFFVGDNITDIQNLFSEEDMLELEYAENKISKEKLESERKILRAKIKNIKEESRKNKFQKSFCTYYNIQLDEIEVFSKGNKRNYKNFLNTFNNFQSSISESGDYLYQFIKFTNTFDIKKIIDIFNAIKRLICINNIKCTIDVYGDEKITTKLYVNSKIYINQKGEVDKKSFIYRDISLLNSVSYIKLETMNARDFLNYVATEKTSQYFGPLRPYPNKEDMLQVQKDSTIVDTKENLVFPTKKEIKIIKILTKYKLSFMLFFWPRFVKFYFEMGGFNYFLSLAKKVTTNSSYTSEQLWIRLMSSENLRNKISAFFSDTIKFKSTYKVIVEKTKIKHVKRYKKFWKSEFLDKMKDDYLNKVVEIIPNLIEALLLRFSRINSLYVNELKFIDNRTNTEVSPSDMGLGISQIMPILISSIDSKNKKIYIEQPELHLHPKIQMDIIDEFIRSANQNKNEFIIETHSEHMLLRIMKRIRETTDGAIKDDSLKLTNDDVCILYVDNDENQTYIQELRLSKKGKLLDHWPNGFFEEGYKERFL